MALVSREEGKGEDALVFVHLGCLGQGLQSLAALWGPVEQGNRQSDIPAHMHTLPTPYVESGAACPRPYLPTAKTVSPIVRFCRLASRWATSGLKVPSQIMGAFQEVQVRTLGRFLGSVRMQREL